MQAAGGTGRRPGGGPGGAGWWQTRPAGYEVGNTCLESWAGGGAWTHRLRIPNCGLCQDSGAASREAGMGPKSQAKPTSKAQGEGHASQRLETREAPGFARRRRWLYWGWGRFGRTAAPAARRKAVAKGGSCRAAAPRARVQAMGPSQAGWCGVAVAY